MATAPPSPPPPNTPYVPEVGDVVLAHSCGIVENDGAGIYTDAWYQGKILKVLLMYSIEFNVIIKTYYFIAISVQVRKTGSRARANYYCDIKFNNGQVEKGTPLKNTRTEQYNIIPVSNPAASSARTSAPSPPAITAAPRPSVMATAPSSLPPPPPNTPYVPKVGDVVLAHSCGIVENSGAGIYTDAWYRGKILKVIKRGSRQRVNYYCDIKFDNGQVEKETPVKNIRTDRYNIIPAPLPAPDNTPVSIVPESASAVTSASTPAVEPAVDGSTTAPPGNTPAPRRCRHCGIFGSEEYCTSHHPGHGENCERRSVNCCFCKELLQTEEEWSLCLHCKCAVHQTLQCSKLMEDDEVSCQRCDLWHSSGVPFIPVHLKPGSKDHYEHENCKVEFLKKHLIQREGSFAGKTKGQLYLELFGVPAYANPNAPPPQETNIEKANRLEREADKQQTWDEYCRNYPDPLYRLTMPGSDPNPAGKSTREWPHLATQKLDDLDHNLNSAGYPPGYAKHIFADCTFPIKFKAIKKHMTLHSCSKCKCCYIRRIPGQPFIQPLSGILKKNIVRGPISFGSIRTPGYMNIQVPAFGGQRRMMMSVKVADGRTIGVTIPPESNSGWHSHVYACVVIYFFVTHIHRRLVSFQSAEKTEPELATCRSANTAHSESVRKI